MKKNLTLCAGTHDTVTKTGVVRGLSKFDSTFFGVHPKLADRMDPQVRIMLETTYEAFVDAGGCFKKRFFIIIIGFTIRYIVYINKNYYRC